MRAWPALVPALALLAITACSDPFAPDSVRFYQAVATGGQHTCALATDGSAWCWGKGTDGELGIGVKENRSTPARVLGEVAFQDITAGVNHTCAIAVDGSAYCWGWNAFYERGNVSDPRDAEPVPVSTTVQFTSISAGDHHTCALSVDSIAYCWGANQYGQLGDGAHRTRAEPRPVSSEVRFVQIAAGSWHTCGLTASGEAYCWGRNDFAQLGRGTASPFSSTPAPVNSPVRFRQIDGGLAHTCAVALDLRLYCWGGNEFGELGTGGATQGGPDSLTPRTISRFFPVGSAISAGEHHTCAIATNGNMRCWGRGIYGQLANGAIATHYHPQPVYLQPATLHQAELFTVTAIATGGTTHACALADQRVYCWGTGTHGELGVEAGRYALLPQRVQN